MSCIKVEKRDFVCKLRVYRFVKKQLYKVLVYFDVSCEDICNSKAFVDFATAGRHRGLSSIYIKHNLFRQNKFGPDVDLQNTLIDLIDSHRDVSTFSEQLGLE